MQHIRHRIPLCLLLISIISSNLFSQEKRPMTMIDLLNVPGIGDPQISPDGQLLLYVLSEADWEKNKHISHIWRTNVDGSNNIQLTNGQEEESSPRWSFDGHWIAFLAKRGDDEETQIYLIRNEGGEAKRLTSHETGVSNIAWSITDTCIYFLASDPKTEEEKEREEKKDDVFRFDEDYKQKHLWMISIEKGEERRITQGDYSILEYDISREGQKIVISRAPTPLFDDSDKAEVWVMDINGENALRLTENLINEYSIELSPDNSRVLFVAGANEQFETYYNGNLFLVPASGGPSQLLFPEFPYQIYQAYWGNNSSTIYALVNMGLHSELFEIDLTKKKYSQITEGKHSIGSWRYFYETGNHVFSINKHDNAGDIWILQESSKDPVRITSVYDYLSKDFQLPRQENITWKGEDGVKIEGLLFYPLNYQEGQRYPLVVQTHGGPASSDKYGFWGSWSTFIPVLTAKGYAVFRPNYRGSTGYGNDFLRDMVGHYFNNAHLDVMAGVDYLIKRGIADPDRLVKMGWSAGGHMTNKIITFTDRFKAASSGAGAVNWISMYGQSDVRIYRTPWFGGTPWEEDAPIDVYWENSPLSDISKVTTPTIVLVGENDNRVPMPQSVELYRALKANGILTHLYVAPRAAHGWSELRHRLYKMNIELEWFEKHAMGREYTWEKAPEVEEEEEEKEEE